MKINIKEPCFAFLFFLMSAVQCAWGDLCIDPSNREIESLRRDLVALSDRLQSIESQYTYTLCELKNSLNENNTQLLSMKKELEVVKNQRCEIPNDLLEKLNDLQRSLTDSKELEQIQIKYGNNSESMSTLHYAIKQGNLNAVSCLLANGADANSVNMDFNPQASITAVSRAAICNQIEIARILLDLGADINFLPVKDTHCCFYPIKYAAEFGSGDLVTLFIAHGAILNKTKYNSDHNFRQETPLHIAAKAGNFEAVVALVSGGSDVNGYIPDAGISYTGCDGTPLEYAANQLKYSDNPLNLELVKFLVANGATRRTIRYHENNTAMCPVLSGYLKSVGK